MEEARTTDGETQDSKRSYAESGHALTPRSWRYSLFWAAVVVGVGIVASATINPLFDRSVHWDWMAGVEPTGFAVLTVAFRRRWM